MDKSRFQSLCTRCLGDADAERISSAFERLESCYGESGRHFKAGDARDLARVLGELVDDRSKLQALNRFPEVKGIDENAREMEYRYRALTNLVRDGEPRA